MDYWLYEMYNLNDAERDTYITRGRNYDLVKRYNDPAYTDLIDNKIEFNRRFGDFLGRKWIEIRKDNKQDGKEESRLVKLDLLLSEDR